MKFDRCVFLLEKIHKYGLCTHVASSTEFITLTFILEAFFPPRMALSSKENSFSRMTARLSLSPTYVTTYISGAHISNSLSQLMIVERGALTRKGPLEWPWEREWKSVHCLYSCYFTNLKSRFFMVLWQIPNKVTKAISCWYYSFLRVLYSTRKVQFLMLHFKLPLGS